MTPHISPYHTAARIFQEKVALLVHYISEMVASEAMGIGSCAPFNVFWEVLIPPNEEVYQRNPKEAHLCI